MAGSRGLKLTNCQNWAKEQKLGTWKTTDSGVSIVNINESDGMKKKSIWIVKVLTDSTVMLQSCFLEPPFYMFRFQDRDTEEK